MCVGGRGGWVEIPFPGVRLFISRLLAGESTLPAPNEFQDGEKKRHTSTLVRITSMETGARYTMGTDFPERLGVRVARKFGADAI